MIADVNDYTGDATSDLLWRDTAGESNDVLNAFVVHGSAPPTHKKPSASGGDRGLAAGWLLGSLPAAGEG
jgi:hypothetical protein